jgi:hypothetical protein
MKTMETVNQIAEMCLCAVMGAATILIVMCIYYGLCRVCEEIVRTWNRLKDL